MNDIQTDDAARKSALLNLADRCEAALDADRELDAEIYGLLSRWKNWRVASLHDADSGAEGRSMGFGVLRETVSPHVCFYNRFPAYTASVEAAMSLVPKDFELAIYTNWPLTKGLSENPDGSRTITDETPRGCWVRTYGASEAGANKNIRGEARTVALAIAAIALRSMGGVS